MKKHPYLWSYGYLLGLALSFNAFAQCNDMNITARASVHGSIISTMNNHYFLYGYYKNPPRSHVEIPWRCRHQEILGLPAVQSSKTMAVMLSLGFEIAPIELNENDFYAFWQTRIKLPIPPLSSTTPAIYQYRLIYGKVEKFQRYRRSYQIHILLDNKTELTLFIPSTAFSYFDFRKKNIKEGTLIYAAALLESWRSGYIMQITHSNQIIILQDGHIKRAIPQKK